MSGFELPNKHERVTINGRTGSGKTVFAAWLLSEANYHQQPWIILDFKGDALLSRIERSIYLKLDDKLPKKKGVYYMKPNPANHAGIENWLWKVWRRGKIGLFIDEGYMIPNQRSPKSAFKTILAQGRSLEVPVYTLSQRPVALDRSVFTEADFYASFHLNDIRDQKTVAAFTPQDNDIWDMEARLPKHHSRWYDVKRDYSCILGPCPDVEAILDRFDERLRPKKKFL